MSGFNRSALMESLAEIADKVVQGAEHSHLIEALPINPIEKELVSFAVSAVGSVVDNKLQGFIATTQAAQKAANDAQAAALQAGIHATNAQTAAASVSAALVKPAAAVPPAPIAASGAAAASSDAAG